ncbi:putative feruloyl esterase [Thozetella sp. PMI_491]|nr:putative feruloyl esterase [Thozetella sp. PMI_491]
MLDTKLLLLATGLLAIADGLSVVSTTIKGCSLGLITRPILPGIVFTSINAAPVYNYSTAATTVNPFSEYETYISFCNVTLQYSHRGWNDNITVSVWLPLEGWNGRMIGIGGSGWSALSAFSSMAPPIGNGSIAVGTDGGHSLETPGSEAWFLDADSRVNYMYTQTFFAVAEAEANIIGKKITTDLFDQPPLYSYFDGCSTGGRQGMMLAQRYAGFYDGILAGAPAINWASFVTGEYHPQFVMNSLGHYPDPCVFSAIQEASIAACDGLDGVVDGIISRPYDCHFNASTMIGESTYCNDTGTNLTITGPDAEVANLIWDGPKNSVTGERLWFGMARGTSFSGLASTIKNGTSFTGEPFPISSEFITQFLFQDADYPITSAPSTLMEDSFAHALKAWHHVMSTDLPVLRDFKHSGGKIIHWHGTADQLIHMAGSIDYYNRSLSYDPNLHDFYRFFEAPGSSHCGFTGITPRNPLVQLIDWVENSVAPDLIPGISADGTMERPLCPYPRVAVYQGGNANSSSSWECENSY